ncbi:hypothetical protein GPX89_37475 [Nocardia sp. ET3-3]|uniref:Uncharacterized protein n=1 Tax=Nocardia terrae TaxID=2675851 RepID=A0A7K1V8D4_9NOCA|nr:hypothetical protein [Nocardia terrae]MVU82915.1 hypothetical protein [Nocardia terrae]
MNARTFFGAALAVVALTMTGNGVASADVGLTEANNADFLDGDTLYFADWLGTTTCAIHANGDVGCDLQPGYTLFGFIPVSDVVIDSTPILPAHPTFGLGGTHGRAGSRWITDVPRDGSVYQGTRIDYAGVTCIGGLPHGGALNCTSKGHKFTLQSSIQIS